MTPRQPPTMHARPVQRRLRAVGEATIAIVFALALMLSLVNPGQQAVATTSAEHGKSTGPHRFEPNDVLIEIPRQGAAKGP
jgi:hypothetical protein